MKIFVVQACADRFLAKTRRNAKSAKTTIKRAAYPAFGPGDLRVSSRLRENTVRRAPVQGQIFIACSRKYYLSSTESLRALCEKTVIHLAYATLRGLPDQGIRGTGFSRRPRRDSLNEKSGFHVQAMKIGFALVCVVRYSREVREETRRPRSYTVDGLPYHRLRALRASSRPSRESRRHKPEQPKF